MENKSAATLHLSGSGAQWTELSLWSFAEKRSTIYRASAWSKNGIKLCPLHLPGEFSPLSSSLRPTHLPCIWGVPIHQDQRCHLGSTACYSCNILQGLSGDAPVKNQWNYVTLAPSRRCRRSSMFFGASSKSLPQPTWGVSWAAMGAETHVTNLWKYISHLDKMSLQPLEPHVPVSNRFENVPSWDPWDQALTQQPLETRPLRWGFLQFHRGIWGTYSLLHHSCRRSLSRSHRSPGTWRWTSTSILPSRDGNKMK